jgi:hypothetical protein
MKFRYIFLISLIIFLIFFHFTFLRYLKIEKLDVEGKIPNYFKKVAICISGQFRDIDICIRNHLCLDPLKADIFIFADDNLSIENKLKIESFYKPVKCVWDSEDVKPLKQYPMNMLRMFKRIYHCDLLRRNQEEINGCKYDSVIRIRPDLILKEFIPAKMVNNLEKETIYVPIQHQYDFWWRKIFGPTDMFAIGDSDSMRVYSDCWLNLQNLEVDTCPGEKIIFNHYMDEIKYVKTFKCGFVLYSMRFNWDVKSIFNILKNKVFGKKEFWYIQSLKKCIKNNRLNEKQISYFNVEI